MRIGTRIGLASVIVIAGVCLVANSARSQDKPAAAGGEDPMQAYMKAAAPGAQHKALEPMAGKFKYVNKFKMDPSQEWTTSEGTYDGEMALDGRYLLSEVQGPMMGMQFTGMGCLGYDNVLGKYVSAWIDNMGTGIMRSEGTSDDGGKTITFGGEMMCPMEHTNKPYKYVYEVKGNDEFTMRWWSPAPDGKMFESMVITYTRAK